MTTPDGSPEAAFLVYRATRSPDALARVYDMTAARLLAVAMHISSSSTAAEDAVQDTFLLALENPERWDPSRPLVPWLLGILGNRLKQSVHRARRTPDPARLNLPDPEDPAAELETNEVLSHIELAITRLAQPYRAVVLLRLRNGLSPADIAVALDRKPSTVRAQLARGVEMLRKVLPVGVTSVLVGSLMAGRGLAAVRVSVLEQATTAHRAFRGLHRAELLRLLGLAATACLVVALTIWLAAASFAAPAFEPMGDRQAYEPVEREPVVHARPVELAPLVTAVHLERTPVALTGAVTVIVSSANRLVPNARVVLEPLGDPPSAFVHWTSGPSGAWSVTVPGRPAHESLHRHGVTAADGRCTVSGLAVGHWLVHSVDADEIVEVVPDGLTQLELRTKARIVRGVVVDRFDAPVAGARIWVCRARVERLSREVARTDETGRFEIAVPPDAMVGARHVGYACVGLSLGSDNLAGTSDLVLRLDEVGAGAIGRILDERGQPVAGATVQIGHPADTKAIPAARSARVLERPVRVTTDAAGRFRCDGLCVGTTWLSARAPGFGTAGQIVTLLPGTDAEVTLTLTRAGMIVGTLRGADGRPVAGASVRVGGLGDFSGSATTTGADGSYRLAGLTQGRCLVTATDHCGGFASGSIACRAGEVVTWNPEFRADALQLRGQVLGRTGRPFARGWIAHMTAISASVHRLDGDGRFRLLVHERAAALPTSIRVYDHDPRGREDGVFGAPLAVARDLIAGTNDIEIRLPAPTDSTVWVEGRFLDEAGVLEATDVFLDAQIDGRSRRIRLAPINLCPAPGGGLEGGFRVGPVPQGRYTISVMSPTPRQFGPFVIGPDTECDLGLLRITAAADAVVSDATRVIRYLGFVWPGDVASSEHVDVEICDAQRRLLVTKSVPPSIGGESDNYVLLPVGRYVATATSASGLVAVREFEIGEVPQPRAIVLALLPE